jgi:hypothetical protein
MVILIGLERILVLNTLLLHASSDSLYQRFVSVDNTCNLLGSLSPWFIQQYGTLPWPKINLLYFIWSILQHWNLLSRDVSRSL